MNLVFMLRVLAARGSAALPNLSRCMAEENAVIPAGRSKSETSNSRVAGKAAFDLSCGNVRNQPEADMTFQYVVRTAKPRRKGNGFLQHLVMRSIKPSEFHADLLRRTSMVAEHRRRNVHRR